MNETTDSIDNTFAVTLGQLARGRVLAELGDAQRKAILAVRETGRKAKLTLTLTFDPVKNAEGEQVDIIDDIRVSTPKPTRRASIFFTEDDGGLSRTNPLQRELFEEQKPRLVNQNATLTVGTPVPAAAQG